MPSSTRATPSAMILPAPDRWAQRLSLWVLAFATIALAVAVLVLHSTPFYGARSV